MTVYDADLLNLIQTRCNAGESLSKVCTDLNLNPSSASRALSRNGIKLSRFDTISHEQLEHAKKLYAAGKSQQQIADLLGIKRSTLALKLRSSQFQMRSRYEASQVKRLNYEVILEAHNQYCSTRKTTEIAKTLGLTKSGLIENFRFYGLQVQPWEKFSTDFIAKINKELEAGSTLTELSKNYDFSKSGFQQAARRKGIKIYNKNLKNRRSSVDSIKSKISSVDKNVKEQVLNYYYDCKSLKEIGRIFQLGSKIVAGILREKGIVIGRGDSKITEPQLRKIHQQRVDDGIGISTLAAQYGVGAATVYERLQKLGLVVAQNMGTAKRVHSDDYVRELYEKAHAQGKSLAQIVDEAGGSDNDKASVTRIGLSLGLKPPTADEITGHNERTIKLYVLRVTSGDQKVGIYAGSSIDPETRAKQHLKSGIVNKGVNKRDAFIHEAQLYAANTGKALDDWFSMEIIDGDYNAINIGEAETKLIKKFESFCAANDNHELLNGVIGAPFGGYGRKIDHAREQEIIQLYENGRNSQSIAAEYGVGRSTINRIIQKSGKQKKASQYLRKYSKKIREQIFDLHQRGISMAQISRDLDVNYQSVVRIVKEKN